MNSQRKKIGALCILIALSGGLIGLTARSGHREPADAAATAEHPTFLNDPNLPGQADISFASKDLFLKMMFSVALVIVLGVAALYLSKKVLPKVTNAPGKEIHVLETAYLGPRKALHLVEVGHQRLLIGSTHESIAMLAHVTDAWIDLPREHIDDTVKM